MPRLEETTRTATIVALAAAVLSCSGDRATQDRDPAQGLESQDVLRAENVPVNLRHLIPLAEKWGIGDDVERAEFIERASTADRQELARALAPHQRAITAWLDSFEMKPLSDEAAAFMYMQLAVEEMREY